MHFCRQRKKVYHATAVLMNSNHTCMRKLSSRFVIRILFSHSSQLDEMLGQQTFCHGNHKDNFVARFF